MRRQSNKGCTEIAPLKHIKIQALDEVRYSPFATYETWTMINSILHHNIFLNSVNRNGFLPRIILINDSHHHTSTTYRNETTNFHTTTIPLAMILNGLTKIERIPRTREMATYTIRTIQYQAILTSLSSSITTGRIISYNVPTYSPEPKRRCFSVLCQGNYSFN